MINGHLTPVVDWFGLPYIGPPHWLVVLNSERVAPWAGNYRYFSKEQRRCVNSDNLKLETQPLRVYQYRYMPADFLVRNSSPHGLSTPPPSFYIGSLLGQKLHLVEFVPGRWSRRACGLIRADMPFPRLEVPYRSSAAWQVSRLRSYQLSFQKLSRRVEQTIHTHVKPAPPAKRAGLE